MLHSNGGVNASSTAQKLTPCKKILLPELHGEKRMKIYFVEDLNIDLLCRSQMKNSSQLLSELSGRARTLKATAKI